MEISITQSSVIDSTGSTYVFSKTAISEDPSNDTTEAIQERLNYIVARYIGGGSLYFPPGAWHINETIHIGDANNTEYEQGQVTPLTLKGDGDVSHIQWNFDGDLFNWVRKCHNSNIRDLRITATVDMHNDGAAFNIGARAYDLTISNIMIDRVPPAKWGTGIRLSNNVEPGEAIVLKQLQFWHFRGSGIELQHADSVWISESRLVGEFQAHNSSKGLHLKGHTGGIWVSNVDFSEFKTGVLVEPISDCSYDPHTDNYWLQCTNRELFITGGAIDACTHGLVIKDDTFVTLTGAWLASCNSENILIEGSPKIEITGGIIFNAGTNIQPKQGAVHHGIVIKGQNVEVTISGVKIKNNYGTGLLIEHRIKALTVTGCTFIDNKIGTIINGRAGIVSGNTFTENERDLRKDTTAVRVIHNYPKRGLWQVLLDFLR